MYDRGKRFPSLVPDAVCTTKVEVLLDGGLNIEGAAETTTITAMCNYQERPQTILDDTRQWIKVNATAHFNGDIAPKLDELNGFVVVPNNRKRKIFNSMKARNLDGTVNYTRLELI